MIFTNVAHLQQTAKSNRYWKNWRSRWEYMQVVQEWLQLIEPGTVLEAGCNGVPVCLDSNTIGLDNADILHDLTETPWPLMNKQYNTFIALQVFEHLAGKQHVAFEEANRIANHIILSLPYKWHNPGNCHHGIDMETICEWTKGHPPEKTFMTNELTNSKRIVCYWGANE